MNPEPILSFVPIESIRSPLCGFAYKCNNDIPYSYIFLPPRKMWPDLFAKMMKEKVAKKKNNVELILISFLFFLNVSNSKK